MFADNTLMPRETIRLAALGLLARGPRSYAALADEVRHFVTRYAGPTLDTMGSSIELLRFEGLIEAREKGETPAATVLDLTDKGRAELDALLGAAVRAPGRDFNKLAIALKLRFMHLLPRAEQREQIEGLIEMREAERARLVDLHASSAGEEGYLPRWLDHDIAQVEADLAWFSELRDELDGD
ncbi:MAG: hypothetical protein ACE5H8_02710 [Alphaproteobacteria bacterium]